MNNPDEINFFGKTNFRNQQVPFGIKLDDRRRHMYLIGKTGMGKSSMMESMVVQDIRNGHGVCFIDPHGDLIQKILDYIPNDRVNDVVYFNPADLEHPIAFNILESVESRYKHLVASGLMGVFTKIWANMWSSRMEYILNNTILALLDSPGNTMLGIVRMYVDKKYRKRIIDNIKDPMVKSFWVEEFANYAEKFRTEAVAPIQNKVGQFLSSSVIRNIVGQPKSTIDLREIMDNQKILLVDLSKGKVGEDNSALLGAMIITRLQLAALSRVDIPESDRKDFFLYVDEFQNFVTDSFATILSEARKYRLNLIMAHQYIGQLTPENNTKVRDAVFGNVGTMVVFRVGSADAEYLETEFDPHYTPTDIVNIPKWHILLKLMINGVASEPFSAMTIPLNDDWKTNNAEKVIRVSRERYANNREEVEEKIARWMGVDFQEASSEEVNGGDKPSIESPRNVQRQQDNIAPTKPYNEPQVTQQPVNNQSNQNSNSKGKQVDEKTSSEPVIRISSKYMERVQQNNSKPQNKTFDKPIDRPNRPLPPAPAPQQKKQPHFDAPKKSKNDSHQKKPKPQNNIWDKANEVKQEKSQKMVNQMSGVIENAFKQPKAVVQPKPEPIKAPTVMPQHQQKEQATPQRKPVIPEHTPKPDTESSQHNPKVLKPGEVQTF